MTWNFADSFDFYATGADMGNGYWDSYVPSVNFTTGRFTGSKCCAFNPGGSVTKASGANDAVHHIVCSVSTPNVLSGTNLGSYFELLDGATAQCSVVFKQNGDILLTSGGPAGTVLATYAGALTVINTWYAFEFEVVINNTTGSFTVRKNGNTSADFTATGLNTRASANNYANKLTYGSNSGYAQYIDDMFWQSSSATGSWLGDIRCYSRMPSTDSSVAFSQSISTLAQTVIPTSIFSTTPANRSQAIPFVASATGQVASGFITTNAGSTGNMKFALYDATGVTLLATSNVLNNPVSGVNTFTFPTPPTLVKGQSYYLAYDADATISCSMSSGYSPIGAGGTGNLTYSSFPTSGVSTWTAIGNNSPAMSLTYTPINNSSLVSEAQEDGLTTYVYANSIGAADFYTLPAPAFTPSNVIATVVRAYATKSDAGSRTLDVQLNSGGTVVSSPAITLTTSNWQWAWRMDLVDPNTGAAWLPAAVNAALIGPKIVS